MPLVDTLLTQHQVGRRVGQAILQPAPGSRNDRDDRKRLIASMQSFIHVSASRCTEEPELFPLLRSVVSAREYDAMAEDFEKKER